MAAVMTALADADEDSLREEITAAHLKLGDLSAELQSTEAELEVLGDRRETYELLERALGSIEQLEESGVAHLFWGDDSEDRTAQHAKAARERADDYLGQVGEIERAA